jgi:hypothetical protein
MFLIKHLTGPRKPNRVPIPEVKTKAAAPQAGSTENKPPFNKPLLWGLGVVTLLFMGILGTEAVRSIIKNWHAPQATPEDPALIEQSVRECRAQAKAHPIQHAFASCLSGRGIPEGPTLERLIQQFQKPVDAGNVLKILQ